MKTVVLFSYEKVAQRMLGRLTGAIRVHDRPQLLREIVDAKCMILSNGGLPFQFVDEEVLASAKSLRFIQMYGVSTDVLDVAQASKRGVLVANVPGANSTSVAEIGFLLLLALAKGQASWDRHIGTRELGSPFGIEFDGKVTVHSGVWPHRASAGSSGPGLRRERLGCESPPTPTSGVGCGSHCPGGCRPGAGLEEE